MVVPEHTVVRIPDAVTYQMAACAEPLAVAVRAIKRSRLNVGDSVAVIGAGPIGFIVLQAARAAGAAAVFVVEALPRRRGLPTQLRVTAAFDPSADDIGKQIADRTGGIRTNVTFECVGNQNAFDTAVRVTGRRGSLPWSDSRLNRSMFPSSNGGVNEKEITTSRDHVDEYPAALALLADDRVSAGPMITKSIGLDRFVEEGLEEMIRNPEGNVTILVRPLATA